MSNQQFCQKGLSRLSFNKVKEMESFFHGLQKWSKEFYHLKKFSQVEISVSCKPLLTISRSYHHTNCVYNLIFVLKPIASKRLHLTRKLETIRALETWHMCCSLLVLLNSQSRQKRQIKYFRSVVPSPFSLFLFLLRGFPSTWFNLYLLKAPFKRPESCLMNHSPLAKYIIIA